MQGSPPITVTDLRIGPGRVDGQAGGAHGDHRVTIRVAPLEPGAWERVVAALVADPALVAAILDGDLPAGLVAAMGQPALEPSPGELRWECGCGRPREHCAHVQAVWRAVLDALERQPALVLALRGRDAVSLAADASSLAALARRDQDLGVDAAAAYERTAGGLPPLPDIRTPDVASRPDSWLEPDILPQRLLDQAADAASRALDILREAGDGCLDLDLRTDVARIGAAFASPWDVSHLAWRAGMSPVELGRLIQAWKAGATGDRAPAGPARQPPSGGTAANSEIGPALEQMSLFDTPDQD
jgi:uncharacterized Zn finger protein